MPINFFGLQSQIHSLGESAVSQKIELQHKLQDCRDLMNQHANDIDLFKQAVDSALAREKGLRCAVPVTEALSTSFPPAEPPASYSLIAADGSQINPDPHGSVLYGLINVGMIILIKGSGCAPEIITQSELLYDHALESASGFGSEDFIALLRDVKEREALVDIVKGKPSPVITLTDGPLELYHEPRKDPTFDKKFNEYQSALSNLAKQNVITAGYVDRPRADLVVRLLELLVEPDPTRPRPFAGITDLALYQHLLQPGNRSAVFKLQSTSSSSYEGSSALHFFYINVGSNNSPALARVEIPLWVAENAQSLAILQSLLVEQANQTIAAPYPYALSRAHEIAVVRTEDRQELTEMIEIELLNRGFPPSLSSNKQSNKTYSNKRGRL